MRISDWSSEVCSSDLADGAGLRHGADRVIRALGHFLVVEYFLAPAFAPLPCFHGAAEPCRLVLAHETFGYRDHLAIRHAADFTDRSNAAVYFLNIAGTGSAAVGDGDSLPRSEEHTSELQSLMRISYAGFCLKKKNKKK